MSEAAAPAEIAVRLRGITKRFPGVLANDRVDLEVQRGDVLALLGENGAGKSTLMNILAGLYRPDEGQVLIHGRAVQFRSPREAIAHGIGMVHQHFMLVESLTVAENVVLGLASSGAVLQLERVNRALSELSKRYGLQVDPQAYIWQLSVGEQQRVEILKMLYRGADILILDEPTAVLTPQEVADLARTLRQMADEGKTVIFITHKLDEVMAFADQVAVLRAGRVIAKLATQQTTKEELARLMVGREVLFNLEKGLCQAGEAALEVQGLQALNDKGLPALRGISLDVCAGEVLGIAGVAGNGQRELAEVITGLRAASSGRVKVFGRDITNQSPLQVIEAGVSHIPGDRLGVGLAGNLPLTDNLALKAYRQPPLARGPILDRRGLLEFARRLIQSFNIIAPNAHTPARQLSGGNQQRVILAREITAGRGVLVAVDPARGLDVGATEAVRRILLEQRQRGSATLLISEDLDELAQLSDRIAVMFDGQIMGIVPAEGASAEQIGLMMAGQRQETLGQEAEK
jgi:ABC-type uncharacterized transport system ATPase subunit